MDMIRKINEKYAMLEEEVHKKLENVRREEEKLAKLEGENNSIINSKNTAAKVLSYEEALQRNADLLKSLEMVKARLRSRSTYSPVEQILQKAIENYERDVDHATPRCKANQPDLKKGDTMRIAPQPGRAK